MRITFITFGILQAMLILKLSYNNALEFKFTNYVCESYNKSWFVFNECRLRAVSRNRTILNLNGTILHPANNIKVHMQLLKRANGWKPWLFNVTIDCCEYLRKPYNPVGILIFKLYRDFTNFNHTCPYKGPAILKGFYLRPEVLRLPFPTGQYLLEMTWIFDNKPQFITNAYFRFVEDLLNT